MIKYYQELLKKIISAIIDIKIIKRALGSMSEQYKKLMQNFRISIRRRQIDQLFQTQRQELLREQAQHLKQQLHFKLKTKQQRQIWLKQMAEKLASYPSEEWTQIMKNLYYAVSLYQNQHQKWIQLGIIKSVCQLFKKQYLYLNLSKLSANILTDLLYTNSSARNENYQVVKKIIQIQFINDVVELQFTTTQVQYLRLMGIICDVAPTMRNFILDHYGILDFIVDKFVKIKADYVDNIGVKGQQQFKNTQYLYCLLYLLNSLLKIHQFDKDTWSKPKKQTIIKTLPILNFLLQQPLSNRNICLVLKSIRQICLLQKQQIYQQIISYPSIMEKTIQLLCYESRTQIRLISIQILSNFLLSKDPAHTRYLLEKCILDKVYQAYFMECGDRPNYKKDYNNLRFGLLGFLGNLTADFWQFQLLVINHKIMVDVIMAQAINSFNEQIRRQAVYSLCNMLYKLSEAAQQPRQQTCQKLLSDYKIIDILLSNITRSDRSVQIVTQILNLFKQVLINQDRNSGKQNCIRFRNIFKEYYGIQEILENVTDFQEEVQDLVMEFLDFFRNLDTF